MSRARHLSLLVVFGAASLALAALCALKGRSPGHAAGGSEPVPRVAGDARTSPAPMDLARSAIQTPQELRAYVTLCRSAGPAQASSLVEAASSSEDPLVAGNAIRALGRLRLAGSDSRVAEFLRDPRPRVRQEAIVALGNSGDPAAVDVLQPLLDDEDSTVRRLALRSLGRIGGSRARALVETVARDAHATDTDRAFARAALSARERELTVARRADSPRVPVATVPRD